MITVAVFLPTPSRAQPDPADAGEAMVILLHPSIPTTVQLPEEIVDAQIRHRGEFLVETVGLYLNVRPRPETRAGTEALITVETRTSYRRFRLRVVERPEDAMQKLVLPGVKTGEHTGEARQEVPPVAPTEPTASTPESAPAPPAPAVPAQVAPEPAPEPARDLAEPVTERTSKEMASRAFDLSVHALVSLGITALDVPGYEPDNARQPHGGLGLRLTVAPRHTWWALEANVSGEWPAGSLTFTSGNNPDLELRGPWLRAEAGARARIGSRWMPSVYVGVAMHAHIRTMENKFDERTVSVELMKPGAALALGLGLQYRAGAVLLGIDFQVRHGGPDNYLSIAALWTVGRFLDLGD